MLDMKKSQNFVNFRPKPDPISPVRLTTLFQSALVIWLLTHKANHRLAFYKLADKPFVEVPTPYDDKQGLFKNKNNFLEPIWQVGPILPSALVDIADSAEQESEQKVCIELDDFDVFIEEKEDVDSSTD